jgi:hypothetical protein
MQPRMSLQSCDAPLLIPMPLLRVRRHGYGHLFYEHDRRSVAHSQSDSETSGAERAGELAGCSELVSTISVS